MLFKMSFVILFSICVVKCVATSRNELEEFSNFLELTSQLDFNVKSKGPEDDYDEEEPVSDNAWEESGKFEGDLILNERQRRLLVADVAEGLSRNGLQDSTKRWPNNEVIYFIQREHFSIGQARAIEAGIEDLAQVSCVKFTPYKRGDRDAVVIQGSRRGCFSQVGYQGGYQVLNLSGRHPVGRGCFRHGTIVHELLHSLGFYHMQSSPDRDDYIDVVWPNIVRSARHNFRKYNFAAVNDFGVGYDYQSVLHYSRKAFSSNGQDTLVPKQAGAEIGQRIGLSQKDIQKLNRMYCDIDLEDSNAVSDSVPEKPAVTKKKSKNKPFDGHGIGYHQGKTVVIKLEPMIEIYRLPNLPIFQTFDHFSNAQQVLPQTIANGDERKMIDDSRSTNFNEYYKPSKTLIMEPNDAELNIATKPVKDETTVELVDDENESEEELGLGNGGNLSEELSKEILEAFGKISNQLKPQFEPANTYFIKDISKYYNPERRRTHYSNGFGSPVEFKDFRNEYGKHIERNHNFASLLPQSHDSLVQNKSDDSFTLGTSNYSPNVFRIHNY